MNVIDIIVHVDGTVEEVERTLTAEEEDWAINGLPWPDEQLSASAALDIIMGGVDVDEG